MKDKSVALISAVSLAIVPFASSAKADTNQAVCDFYRTGASASVSASMPCTFSQSQGHITIHRQDGTRYEFSPNSGSGNFVDRNGNPIYRQSGLGERGLIFRSPTEAIYVYWDARSTARNRVGILTASDAQARINLRQAATIRSRSSGYGRVNERVEILAVRRDSDTPESNLSWCQVRFLQSGAIGWIRSDFIRFDR